MEKIKNHKLEDDVKLIFLNISVIVKVLGVKDNFHRAQQQINQVRIS